MHSKNKTDIATISDRMTRSGQWTLNGRRKRPKNEKINGEVNCGTSGVHCQRTPSELIAAYNKWRNVSLIKAAIYQMLCKHLFGLRRGDVGGVVVFDGGGGGKYTLGPSSIMSSPTHTSMEINAFYARLSPSEFIYSGR